MFSDKEISAKQISDKLEKIILLLEEQNKLKKEFFFFAYPGDGTKKEIGIGTTVIDFYEGNVKLPTGIEEKLSDNLKAHDRKVVRSFAIESDQPLKYRLDDGGLISIDAYDTHSNGNQLFSRMTLITGVTTKITIHASINPEAFLRKVSKVVYPSGTRFISIFMDNDLNQAVSVQVKGNRIRSVTKAINIGLSISVSANSSEAKSLSLETSGWLPYIYVEVTCSIAPVSGSLTIYLIIEKDELKLVEALEIRDTTTHTPATDPTKVFIKEW